MPLPQKLAIVVYTIQGTWGVLRVVISSETWPLQGAGWALGYKPCKSFDWPLLQVFLASWFHLCEELCSCDSTCPTWSSGDGWWVLSSIIYLICKIWRLSSTALVLLAIFLQYILPVLVPNLCCPGVALPWPFGIWLTSWNLVLPMCQAFNNISLELQMSFGCL